MRTLADRTPEERKEIAAAGGRASGEARRRRAKVRDELSAALQAINPETGNTLQLDMCAALAAKAAGGDIAAIRQVVNILGEASAERVEILHNITQDERAADIGMLFSGGVFDGVSPLEIREAAARVLIEKNMENEVV